MADLVIDFAATACRLRLIAAPCRQGVCLDPLALVFIPGGLVVASAIVAPLGWAALAWRRKRGLLRNRRARCGRCNEVLRFDGEEQTPFLIQGVYHCPSCAARRRRQYAIGLVALPGVAILAALTTATGIVLGGADLSWYLGARLIPVALPSAGLSAWFWWRVRRAKRLNALAAADANHARESDDVAPTAQQLESLGA